MNVDTQRRLVVHDSVLGGALQGEGLALHLETLPNLFGQKVAVSTTFILAGQDEAIIVLAMLQLHDFGILNQVLASAPIEVSLPALEIDVVD